MKQKIFTILLFTTIGLISCRKNTVDPSIKQYDDEQIRSYISSNGLTGMLPDTSGLYYKIIQKGTGAPLQYTDSVAFVYTIHSFDGKYISTDTIFNHYENFVGHIASTNLPLGLQEGIYNLLKYRGGSMRLLIPSHLAYGVNGIGSGSSSVTNANINGNQCLDYYIHTIDNEAAYDDLVIKNFLAASNLTASYKKTASGLYYNIRTQGTGTVPITNNTTITATYTEKLLDGTIFDASNDPTLPPSIDIPDMIAGMQEGLKNYATAGALITFIIPSTLAYGKNASTGIPPNSCVIYEIQVITVAP